MVHRKDTQDTSERWFGVTSVASSVVEESSGQQGVRISNVVKVGGRDYLTESVPAPQILSTRHSAKNPAKGKRKRSVTPVSVAPKRPLEFEDESVVLPKGRGANFDHPNSEIASKNLNTIASSSQSGRSCRAAPVFQSSLRQLTYHFIFLQVYFIIDSI